MQGACAGWLRFLQPLFNFTASKYVFIKDWRLGVILRTLQVGILVYVLTDIILKASYLTTEVPTGLVTVWPNGQTFEMKKEEFFQQQRAVKEKKLEYCTDPGKYAFDWSGINYKEFECAFLDSPSLFADGESQVFLTTAIRVEKMHYYTKDAGVCAEAEKLGEGYRKMFEFDGACSYSETKGYFPINPEDMNLTLLHSYRTSSVVDKSGTLPRTIVRAPGYNDKGFERQKDEQLKIALKELLDASGIDLDARLNEQANPVAVDKSQAYKLDNGTWQYPYARLSGLTLHASFNYYTRRLAPNSYQKAAGQHTDDVICLLDIKPEMKWSFMGSDIRQMMNEPQDPLFITPQMIEDLKKQNKTGPQIIASQTDIQRHGLTIIFSVSGSVGTFDIAALINALVAGSVLLAVAQFITTYVALYALGISSELYRAFMRETVDWRQEYARYAAQACVAGYAFMQYDENSSMKLDRKEIFDTLKKLFKKKKDMKDWQMAALTDFLMRQGETSTKVEKGRFRANASSAENFIDIEEWIDIFTEDKANWPALKRLIEHEYPDEESQERVMDLLELSVSRKKERSLRNFGGIVEEEREIGEEEETDGTPMSFRRPSEDIEANAHTPFLDPTIHSRSAAARKTTGRASL